MGCREQEAPDHVVHLKYGVVVGYFQKIVFETGCGAEASRKKLVIKLFILVFDELYNNIFLLFTELELVVEDEEKFPFNHQP